jgi:3-deoxy-D-manno-octulosonic-acid transferase
LVIARRAYGALLGVLAPVAVGYLLWRGRREPGYRRDLGHRFGNLPADLPERPLWLHVASVGEARAIEPVLTALLEHHPGLPVVVTTFTPTGRAQLQARFGERIRYAYLPLDLPFAVRRFVRRLRPRLGVILELELWPNLFAACREAEIPLILANARLSRRSLARYRRLPGLFGTALGACQVVAAQTRADAERLQQLGAPPERIVVHGNIKFDLELPQDLVAQGRALRATVAARRPVWIAASTHEGEDEAAIAAHRRIRERFPDALLLLVPRHPARFGPVAELVRASGLTTARRSAPARADAGAAVLIGDSMGEMALYLAASDVAFMGGSLVPVGGHNPLEPAALGLPVVSGPEVFNFERVDALLGEAGARLRVTDAESLAQVVGDLLSDPAQRARIGAAAAAVVEANRGAGARLLAEIETRLGGEQ